jgi:hypothetical protein
MNGKCALCNKDTELKESHIIPKFVFTWLKETGGAIRSNSVPNVRVQDGEKEYLLCGNCEELFSSWEKPFCEEIFLPLEKDPNNNKPIRYGIWALKFAVSVSWRVLLYYYHLHDLSHFSETQKRMAIDALEVWRKFLLGDLPNPEQFEQHLVIVDVIKSYSGPKISPFLNRYFARTIHVDVICSNKSAMSYAKMGRIILFGFIQGDSKHWQGTKLHVNKGFIIQKDIRLPQNVADYWNEKANEDGKILGSISPKQSQKIQKYILDNADRVATSDLFRAMQYDVYHSRKMAFKITDPDEDNSESE